MRIVAMSDTHNQMGKMLHEIPDGDVFIFTGDISGNSLEELNVKNFRTFLNSLPHEHKVIICGNHDFIFQNKKGSELLKGRNIHYLEDSGVTINGVNFYGTPYQPYFYNWAFNIKNGEDLKKKWDMIPDNTHVLLTHNPPYGIMDETERGDIVGSKSLLDRIALLPELKVHCFGHIHEGYGIAELNGIKFVNSCICNENYKPVNAPIVFDI